MKIVVIEPDEASGEYFLSKLSTADNLNLRRCMANIAPRVLKNKINESDQVTKDFQDAILDCRVSNEDAAVIACNTLQLWLPKIDSGGVKIITTFEAVDWKIKKTGLSPVWLGTWPLVREINSKKKYKTLVSLGRSDLQDLLQELIWRTKAVEGSDISGAGDIEGVRSVETLKVKSTVLFESFEEIGVNLVVLGCTELPLLIDKYLQGSLPKGITLWDPAELIAEMLKV